MGKYSELESTCREQISKHIGDRWSQLHKLEEEWAERALKFLMLTNSGGAIATLSFLGAKGATLNVFGTKLALAFFVVGIILIGMATAKTFHHMSGLYKKYKMEVGLLYDDKISWEQLRDQDNGRAKADAVDYVLPYLAFVCFIAGCASGAYALFA